MSIFHFSQGMQRIKAAVPGSLCTLGSLCSPGCCPSRAFPSRRELSSVTSSIPSPSRVQWMLFGARHGRSSEEANFSTLPELGQAETVPWKPYKAGEPAPARLTLPPGCWGREQPSLPGTVPEPLKCSRCSVLARGTAWPPW